MLSVSRNVNSPSTQSSPPPVVAQLDLVEWEAEHEWEQYLLYSNEARRRLARYDAAVQKREELVVAVGAALAEAERLLL